LLLNSHSGDALQAITEQIILARFQLASLGPKLRTSSELVHHFPWFARTLCSTLRFTSCLTSKAFPKVVNASGHNSTEQISRALLDAHLFEPNYAYIPAEKSSSEDLALCGFLGSSSSSHGLLKIQCKHHSTDSTMSEADFHSEIFKAYVPNIASTLVFVCTNTKLARALEACAEKRDLSGQPILPHARPIFTSSSSTHGQPVEMIITEQKEITPGVWYFSPSVCDKMRASFVLATYLKHLQTHDQEQHRALKRRIPSSQASLSPSAMDPEQYQSEHAPSSAAVDDSSLASEIQLFLKSMWDPKLFPTTAESHRQFTVLVGKIPSSFELAHLRNTPGCQDALFLSSEALQSLLTPTNYEWLVVKRQTVSLCQSYNSAFSAPLVSEQDTAEISQDLLLLAPPN
jgi:hypothetical protein